MVNVNIAPAVIEKLGPAERIIQTLTTYKDHMVHNRPGVLYDDAKSLVGVRWQYCTHKVEEGLKVVYVLEHGKKPQRVGVMQDDLTIMEAGRKIGRYQPAGIYPEIAVWMYRQMVEVWKMDNEFAAHFASYLYAEGNKDLKTVAAALMLVQSRVGTPVMDKATGKALFADDDFRAIGEAMMLLYEKPSKEEKKVAAEVKKKAKAKGEKVEEKEEKTKGLDPRLLVRIHDLLKVPGVRAINQELGFGNGRNWAGRWPKAVERWLQYREENPALMKGLIKSQQRQTVIELIRRVGYKPQSPRFFEALSYKQKQAEGGHRSLIIGVEMAKESWEDLTEQQVCERIMRDRPGLIRIESLLPQRLGLTRAIMAAAIEAGALSDKQLIIRTPTIEELGLFQVQNIRERVEKAIRDATDMRAANIARNVKSEAVKEVLQEGADNALKKVIAEAAKDFKILLMVDRSGSMEGAIEAAIRCLTKLVQGFPPDSINVCHFNTDAREVTIKHWSAAGVENAFKGLTAGGGTDYAAAVQLLQKYGCKDGSKDNLFFFVGDEGHQRAHFVEAVQASGLNPVAFALLPIVGTRYPRGTAVRETATRLGIPCSEVSEEMFQDPYAIPATIRNLIAATPINAVAQAARPAPRVSLIETILKTELLKLPAWA